MDIVEIENLKKTIESMNKFHQIEILKILSKNMCKINENKSGVYVNLTFINSETLSEMKDYINYITEQEESLNTAEYQKTEFINAFFVEKDNKEEMPLLYS